jgi:hypothetical protein
METVISAALYIPGLSNLDGPFGSFQTIYCLAEEPAPCNTGKEKFPLTYSPLLSFE